MKLKTFEIGYETPYRFTPKMGTYQEEIDINKKLTEAAASEDASAEYAACLDGVAKWTEKVTKTAEGEKQVAVDVSKEFAEATPENERIIRDAFFLIKSQFAPSSRFLDS